MKKVGIITFHRAINYGALLQTYALQSYLKSFGVEAKVLDYRSPALEASYKFKFQLNASGIKSLLTQPLQLQKKLKFRHFYKKNITSTKPLYTQEELHDLNNDFDWFITGSDQVWNGRWSNLDDAYLLNFANDEKKASYAASIGKNTISSSEEKWLRDQLGSFSYISVREKTGKDIVERLKIGNKNVYVHCDPVALLDKTKWTQIVRYPDKKGYILVYMLVPSQTLIDCAIQLGRDTNKEVIILNDNLRKKYEMTYKRFVSPQEFLGYFANAEYVVTNSFHGLMFSVVFEKNVFVELQKYAGAPNSRLSDLLEALGLENRIITGKRVSPDAKIDYLRIGAKMEEYRKNTENYFKKMFECE